MVRMARFFLKFACLALAIALPIAPAAHAETKKPAAPRAAHPKVNYEDPNMAFHSDYATDQALTCPKTLKGKRLRECLAKSGLATSEEISEDAEVLTSVPPSSFH